MLTDTEKALPRRIRRALISGRATLIKKHVPFGRVIVEDIENGETPQDNRICYRHVTRGRMDRRTTVPLLKNLISVGGAA